MLLSTNHLSLDDAVTQLQVLRESSYCPQSHFAVSAIIELALPDNSIAYMGGVNVEMTGLATSAIHAEQNAFASAVAHFGPEFRITKLWVMGGPKSTTKDATHASARRYIPPCGHCRQLLLSYRSEDAIVYSVSINGSISPHTYTLDELLPNSFKELDFKQPDPKNLAIPAHMQSAKPLILDLSFEYNPTTICLLRLDNSEHFTGVLTQDAAFQTTDAFSSAIAQAITRHGSTGFNINEIHLFSPIAQPRLLFEHIEMLRHFTTASCDVFLYHADNPVRHMTLTQYIQDQYMTLLGFFKTNARC